MMSSTAPDNASMYRRPPQAPDQQQWGPRPPQPFNGAAPPIPANLTQSINQASWQAGYWQPNPHYNPTRSYGALPYLFAAHRAHWYPGAQPAFIQWIPAQQWQVARAQQAAMAHQQQQQAQNYNPYRKKVKPPSAEYLASSLSDNPLGLQDMDPTKSLYNDLPPEVIAGLDDGGADNAHTPWIWKPKDLQEQPPPEDVPESSSESGSDDDTDDDEDEDDRPAKAISPPPRESFTSPGPLQPTFSANIVRTPQHYRGGSASIEPRIQNTTPSRQPLSRHSSMPQASSYSSASMSSTTSSSTTSSGSITGQSLSDEPGSLLSPLIISNTPKPSTSTRQLTAASTGSLGRHSSVPAVLSTIPESSNVRTLSYPTPSPLASSTSPSNNTTSASAYAASLGMTHRRHSQDESTSRGPSRPNSRQPSPAHTPPPQAYPQPRNTYPAVPVTSPPPTNPRHHATYPQPSSAPAYQPTSTPVKVPPNTSGPYPYGPNSTSTPTRMGSYTQAYPQGAGLGSQSTQVYYHTPPNSAPATSSNSAYYAPNGSTPTPSSSRKSRTRERRSSVDVDTSEPQSHRNSLDKDRGARDSWEGAHHHRIPAPNFGVGGAVSPGSSYPAYMNGPPATHPPTITTNSLNPYPTPPSGGSGAGASPAGANASSGYSPTKEGAAYQYHYTQHPQQYSHLQQQQRSNSGGTTPNASSSTSTPNHTGPGLNVPSSGPPPKRQVRKGYWNKRGDHLTQQGYVVYAPPKLAYPVDLANYPLDPESVPPERLESLLASQNSGSPSKPTDGERVGYMNEHGNFAPWIKRPELPESLPRHGREAEMPYERFVEYV
ncbi:hypothetical protein MD484_g5285, partial [Candolleomyces efflorescens]